MSDLIITELTFVLILIKAVWTAAIYFIGYSKGLNKRREKLLRMRDKIDELEGKVLVYKMKAHEYQNKKTD